MIPLVLAALAFRQRGSSVRAGIALGAAVLVKLYPLILLPAWWRPRDWRFPAAVAATVVLGYLPHAANVGLGVIGFLPEYLGRVEDHNIGLRALLTYPFGLTGDLARVIAMALLFSLMAGILAWIGRTNGGNAAGMTRAGALAVGTYLLLVPTSMHPWYVLWIVPFLCFRVWPAWLYFTGAVTLSYMSYVVEPAPIPWWAWLAEWGPLGALLLHSGWSPSLTRSGPRSCRGPCERRRPGPLLRRGRRALSLWPERLSPARDPLVEPPAHPRHGDPGATGRVAVGDRPVAPL